MALLARCLLTGFIVLLCASGVASGQCVSGEYRTPLGGTVRWTSCSYFVGWSSRTGIYYTRPRNLEVLEGVNDELVNADNETHEHLNAQLVPYDTLRRARDEMRGQVWPRPNMGVHQCDESDCSYEVQARKPHPFSRKTAKWAMGSYGLYLQENPEDWGVMREFAMVVGILEDLPIATELMVEAYLNDSALAADPIDALFLGIDGRTLRNLVVKCVNQAHRDPTAEAWFMVAVLMQSEGRLDRAAQMLERSIDLGLNEGIAIEFLAVLPAP